MTKQTSSSTHSSNNRQKSNDITFFTGGREKPGDRNMSFFQTWHSSITDLSLQNADITPARNGIVNPIQNKTTPAIQRSPVKNANGGIHISRTRTPVNIIQRTPLTTVERRNLVDEIASEMQTAHTDYNDGAQDAERAITDAKRADADTAKTIFAMGMALIVPGFGGVVAGGFLRFGVTVSTNLASNIGSAIGEAAKSAGNSAIDNGFQASGPTRFFLSITDGWEEAARHERNFLRNNISDRTTVSDGTLNELHTYWLALARNNRSVWNTWFQEQWRRFEAQVGAIGPQSTGIVPFGPTPLSNRNIPARIRRSGGGTRLALINETRIDVASPLRRFFIGRDIRTRRRFIRWIDSDLADLASSRVSSVPTLEESQVSQMP